MFDSIVLLTGADEQTVLPRILQRHRPDLAVRAVSSVDTLRKLDASYLQRARLIAFASSVVVPADILETLGYGAYNFHPGSPNYPGWAPAHFALYDRAPEFGVTFHVMTERVDSGPIIDVLLFPVPDDSTVPSLGELTYAHLLKLFVSWAAPLSSQCLPLTPQRTMAWGGRTTSRRTYRSFCNIPLDISREELGRRMRAFGGNHYGMSPTIDLHGVIFTARLCAEST